MSISFPVKTSTEHIPLWIHLVAPAASTPLPPSHTHRVATGLRHTGGPRRGDCCGQAPCSPALPKAKRQCNDHHPAELGHPDTQPRVPVRDRRGPRVSTSSQEQNSQTQTSQTKQDLRNSPKEPSLEEPSTCGSLIPFPGHCLGECHTISHLEKRLRWPLTLGEQESSPSGHKEVQIKPDREPVPWAAVTRSAVKARTALSLPEIPNSLPSITLCSTTSPKGQLIN